MKWERKTWHEPHMAVTKFAMRLTVSPGLHITRNLAVSDEYLGYSDHIVEDAWRRLRRDILRAIEQLEEDPTFQLYDDPYVETLPVGSKPVGSYKDIKYPTSTSNILGLQHELNKQYPIADLLAAEEMLKKKYLGKPAKVAMPDTTYTDKATSEFEGVADLDPELWKGNDANGFA